MGFLVFFIVLPLIALGGWFWTALVVVHVFLGFRELDQIMRGLNIRPSHIIVYSASFLLIFFAAWDKPQFLSPILTLAIIASFFRLLFRYPRATVSDIGGTLIAVFYIAFLPVHYILLRQLGVGETSNFLLQPGLFYLLFTIFVIAASDVGAYYVGRKFGKSLLYPELSPKKTREGAIGGLFSGILMGIVLSSLLGHFSIPQAVTLSVLLVIVGQLGDLTESLIKRDAGVKDSGALLASHGGYLDRADSYIFSGVVSYYYIHWVVLQQGLAPEVLNWFRGVF